MTKPLVAGYLETHTLEQLRAAYGINHRASSDLRKVSLNYDTIASPVGVKLVDECRGLILRPDVPFATPEEVWSRVFGSSTVVCRPMDRFYNSDDSHAAQVDWKDPRLCVFDKLDGTMIAMYFDHVQGRWHAATRSVPEADIPIRKGDIVLGDTTFSELFFSVFDRMRGDLVALDPLFTYVFELTGPANRVVVEYAHHNVTLLAIRSLTGEERPVDGIRNAVVAYNWPRANPMALKSSASMFPPTHLEGYVVVDSAFRRVKVKSDAYVAASRHKQSFTASKRNALSATFLGCIDDVLPMLDTHSRQKYESMRDSVVAWVQQVDVNFSKWKNKANGDRKSFALDVIASGDYPAIYFELLKGEHTSASALVQSWAESDKLSDAALDAILARVSPEMN